MKSTRTRTSAVVVTLEMHVRNYVSLQKALLQRLSTGVDLGRDFFNVLILDDSQDLAEILEAIVGAIRSGVDAWTEKPSCQRAGRKNRDSECQLPCLHGESSRIRKAIHIKQIMHQV